MTAVFEKILEMSLTAAIVILVVLVIRLCLRKAPRKYSYALWSVAAFRLVCPVSFKAVFSLFTFANRLEETQLQQTVIDPLPAVSPGYFDSAPPGTAAPSIDLDPDYVFTYPVTTPTVEPEVTANLLERAVDIAAIVWLVGLAALIIYGIVSYVRLRRRMSTAVVLEGNVWQSDRVQSPFILGFLRPNIYLPFGLTDDQRRYVLAHENYHIKRLDHIVRPLSYLILAVHWFNPFVWLAYYLMARDMEMSCDEKVLSTGENIRKEYSTTLLSFAANRRFPSPSPLAFGESGVKGRIKNALNWKKPRTWVTIIAIVVCIVVIIMCAANPKEPESLENQNTPYEWAAFLTSEDVDSAALYIPESDPQQRTLTEAEVWSLTAALKQVPKDNYKKTPKNDTWAFPTERMITLTCGGVEYVLNLGPGPMTVSCRDERVDWRGETHWYVNNDELKQFIRDLAGTTEQSTADLTGYLPYVSTKCIYITPLSSSHSADDSGKTYMIGDSIVAIFDKRDNDAGIFFETLPEWRPLTEEEWAGMFLTGEPAVDISHYESPMILELSDEYQLVNMDGTLWMVHRYNDSGIWDIYQLAAVNQTATLAQWQLDVTGDGAADTITVEGTIAEGVGHYVGASLAVTDASGKELWSDGFSFGSDEVADFYLIEQNGSYAIMEWSIMESEAVLSYNYAIIALDGTSAGIRYNWLRCGLTDEELLALDMDSVSTYFDTVQALMEDGTLLLGGIGGEGNLRYSTSEESFTYVWDSPLERLQQAQQEAETRRQEQMGPLAVWQADLTHDGVNESIMLSRENSKPAVYTLTVTSRGEPLWQKAVTAGFDQEGYYLYEKDGKHYLMQWAPVNAQGYYNYNYRIFSLTGAGETVTLAENSLQFDMNTPEAILSLDIDALREFGDEVTALLADARFLLVSLSNDLAIGDPADPAPLLWITPFDDFERQQQYYQIQASQREANTLAVWPLNDLTVTVLKTDNENVYTLDVYRDDYFLWSTELRTQPSYGDTVYLLYREDGREYLAEFTGTSRQGIGMYSYRVFTVRPESLDVLYENSLYYEAMSEETVLTVDIEAIAAFEKEVNGLFKDADIICGTENGQFFWNAGGTDTVFRWYNPDLDRIQQEQQRITEEQNAIAWFQEFLALNPGVNWYNHAMNALYDTTSELDLSLIFYGGFGEWDSWEDFSTEEEAWLIDQGFARHLSAQKRPAAELEAVLNQYFNTSLADVPMPDSWVYYDKTDCYYSNTNDVHAAYRFTVTKVDWTSDGLVRVWYEVGDTYLIDPDTGEQATHAVLTLRAKSGDPYNDPLFVVVSHQSSLDFDG